MRITRNIIRFLLHFQHMHLARLCVLKQETATLHALQ